MAVQFKWNNVIEDDEDGLHVKFQSISYEYSWKSFEKYVINVVKQSTKTLHCSALGDKKLGTKSICEHVQIVLVQYQSLSNEHSWKSLEEYVTNILKQSAELLFKKCYTARLLETS